MILTNEKSSKDDLFTAASEINDLLTTSEKEVNNLREDKRALVLIIIGLLTWIAMF